MPPDDEWPTNAKRVVAAALEHGWTMAADRKTVPWGLRVIKQVDSLHVTLTRSDGTPREMSWARIDAYWHDGSFAMAGAGYFGDGGPRKYGAAELRKIVATKDNEELREWVQAREAARLQALENAA